MLSLKQIEDNGVQGIIVPDNAQDARLLLAYICYYHMNIKPYSNKISETAKYLNENYDSLIAVAGEGKLSHKDIMRFVGDWVYRNQFSWEQQGRTAKMGMIAELNELQETYFYDARENRNDVFAYLAIITKLIELLGIDGTKKVEITAKRSTELSQDDKEHAIRMVEWAKQYNQQALLGDGSNE